MRIPTSFATVPAFVLVATLAGCTTRSATFEGYGDDQVWSAMVAAARTPEYDDWKVRDNEVFVDESGRRLEIFRVLKRLYVTPYAEPQKEDEEWRLQVVLSRDEELGAPTVDFTARQVSVPAHVWREADRYFAQVRSLLGPAAVPPADPTTAAPAPAGEGTPVPPPLPADTGSGASAPSGAGTPAASPSQPEPMPERSSR